MRKFQASKITKLVDSGSYLLLRLEFIVVLKISDYSYNLPEERIARFPLDRRDASKLLVYKHGRIEHHTFNEMVKLLPPDAFLFFNNTKVIPARIQFKKDTGAEIEVFLLTPIKPSKVLTVAMTAKNSCSWQCTIGNLKRWKDGTTLQRTWNDSTLTAKILDRENGIVEFGWTGEQTFAEILEEIGRVPLPPYLNRQADATDKKRYQTVYSRHEGAVAAPTAGLHFTDATFQEMKLADIGHDFLTLHVSAGTFQPVKNEDANDHTMHDEQVAISRTNLENILANDFIVAVGTTSMRTLESLYWYGVKLIENPGAEFVITQTDAYEKRAALPDTKSAIQKVLDFMKANNMGTLIGRTAIYIKPGYNFKVCKSLITNFHQPGSTLILLVAAFVGRDWKKIYDEALANEYRFLSYGDSSLLIP
jgi:S-adenosylmethionine:tRNA ribosyltransferase-isomerase